MIKEMAWNLFKNTGSIDSYLELIETENVERELLKKGPLGTFPNGNLNTQEKNNIENNL